MPIAPPSYRAEAVFSSSLLGYFTIGAGVVGTDRIGGEFSDAGWVNLQDYLMGFEAARGREDELSGISPGTMQLDLDDRASIFDPENASGPYYPNVLPLRRWRVVATYNGVDYPLGYGFATDYAATPQVLEATVGVRCVDLFTRMGRKRRDITYPAQRLDQRIGAMLDEMQWSTSALRALDVSLTSLPSEVIGKGTTMLGHLDDVLKTDLGVFFVAGTGVVTYHSRRRRLGRTSRGTFGAGGTPIVEADASYGDAGIFNDVRIKRTAGTEQVAADTTSQKAYDIRTYALTGGAADYLADDGTALSLATWLVKQRKDPLQRVASITLDPEGDPDTIWPHILTAELGDRITISHNVAGTTGITGQSYFIEKITHRWSVRETHLTTWGLSRAPANLDNYFLIGSGVVGTGVIGY